MPFVHEDLPISPERRSSKAKLASSSFVKLYGEGKAFFIAQFLPLLIQEASFPESLFNTTPISFGRYLPEKNVFSVVLLQRITSMDTIEPIDIKLLYVHLKQFK